MNGFASYPSLQGRVSFVTGGGSGIGASIVEHLCAQQARVAFVDIDRGLGREIRRHATLADDPRHGAEVDDRAAARRGHAGRDGLRREELMP